MVCVSGADLPMKGEYFMMNKNGLRRIFSLLLAVMMVCALLPTAAFAEDTVEPQAAAAAEGQQEPKQDEVKQPEEPKQDEVKQPEGEAPAKVETPAEGNTPAPTESASAPKALMTSPAISTQGLLNPPDKITITVWVHDNHTNKDYTVGSADAKLHKVELLDTPVDYRYTLPDLTTFVPSNTFGSITSEIKGDWNADFQLISYGVGETPRWPLWKSNAWIKYYVDWYTPKDITTDSDWRYNFKLKYDGNGEGDTVSGVPAEQVYRTNKLNEKAHTFTIPGTAPARDGYIFNGWQEKDGSTTYNAPNAPVTLTATQDPSTVVAKELVAVWQKVESPTKPEVVAADIKVKVECTTTDAGHSSEDFALTEESITSISAPVQGEHGYTCDVTISSEDYVPQFNAKNGNVAHTATDETQTISLTYDGGKWSAPAIDTGSAYVTFNVRCDIYTVTYTDGRGGLWFENDVHNNLKQGDATPEYNNGTAPTHNGYTFLGWTPEVAKTVTESVTYTAQWESKAERAVKDLLKDITVKCVSGVDGHDAKTYDTSVGGYTATTTENTDGTFTSKITVEAQKYVDRYNKDTNGNHVLVNKEDTTKTVTVKLDEDYNPMGVATDKPLITFEVKCKSEVVPTETFTVTYTDGVDGEEVFADQTTGNLKAGDKTPAFNGTPTREGYKFAGWNPAVAETVTGSATYTAKWEKLCTVTYTDGVDGVQVFADQVYKNLTSGTDTPAFKGTPKRTGYKFTGWKPEVARTVTEDVTYTAQWEKVEQTFTVTYKDGAKGKAFKEQVYKDLIYGVDTPKFDGKPTRKGYTFAGWSPKVTDTVTKDVTYTATWKSTGSKDNVPKTGDGEIVMILGSVLMFSFCGAAAVCVFDRKRKQG